MPDRFYVESPICESSVRVDGDSAHHILNVMRMQTGDELVLFDGQGSEFLTRITKTGKRDLWVDVLEKRNISRELEHHLILAVALPKGDRQKTLVEKLVELGVSQLIPLQTKRGVAIPNSKTIGKLQRRVIEASKQCGRNRLMVISEAETFSDLVERPAASSEMRLITDPYANTTIESVCAGSEPLSTIVLVGPEGGFTDEETALAEQNGWSAVVFGMTVLRVETAAMAAAVMFGMGAIHRSNS